MRIPFGRLLLAISALLAFTSQAGGGASSVSDVALEQVTPAVQEISVENQSALKVTARAVDAEVLEVTASSNAHSDADALTLKFLLRDGFGITFAMPDHPERNYIFANRAGRVVVEASEIAFIEIAQIN